MEATVRYIPIETAVVDNRTFQVGNKPALCFRGKEYALGIVNADEGILPVRLDLRTHDSSPLVLINNRKDEYPVVKFISHLERIMKEKPISSEALSLIRQWPNNPEDFGDPIIEDEPEVIRPAKSIKKIKKKNCIAVLAEEMKIPATKIRKFLRGKGFKAPYEDEKKIRIALKGYNK